ncbi:MAG: endonuclease/exonuclease/phosphatase family protein [Candidatus Marinimicrobia bacterium]|nr:endonuclease/exonuclease/phosphatase family protein [Candidatus Neomarinimicrobiota bacterium]
MKKIIAILTILIFFVGCNKITVMSYNIHAMRGMDKVLDADRIADVINDQKPDLVALQEVDQFTERSGKMDAISLLEEKTGMHGIFMRTFDYQGGEFGNAILSRYPIIESKLIQLPARENFESRLLMMISCITKKGDTLHFYNTHLDHHQGDSDRSIQMQKIIQVIEKDKAKIILGGDFNCRPGSEPLAALDKTLSRCISEENTYPANEPSRNIDHVYFSEDRGISNINFKVIPEKVASDHRPVVAKFRIK